MSPVLVSLGLPCLLLFILPPMDRGANGQPDLPTTKNHNLDDQVPYCQKLLEKVFGVDVIKEVLAVNAAATPMPEVKNFDPQIGVKKLPSLKAAKTEEGNTLESNGEANSVSEENNVSLSTEPTVKGKEDPEWGFLDRKKPKNYEQMDINKLLMPNSHKHKHPPKVTTKPTQNKFPNTTTASATTTSATSPALPPVEESTVEESPTFTEALQNQETPEPIEVNTPSPGEGSVNQQAQNARGVAETCQPLQEESLCFNDELLHKIEEKIKDIVNQALSEIMSEVYASGQRRCPT
ncbi:hypothetical protein XENTR_v10017390 [Xenopus tropicalis]|uniref:Uncharacterized protein LOC100498231 n=1 Tax=Xenopus tropicalis TaxID=8364 RepID=A0A8J0QVJ8_XENTR|nr:uncharacterized protein LOC100498231 [Xenopus tropicalis]KAE8599903.1 hypothetical protein XENTR_v10017390 [Xenopus tropicalis]|eukprot:XP_002941914.1 PREDICTED: uncharacterized protein LOC100498231 [Xenopus tropicalis]